MLDKRFDNNSFEIRKSKITLALNKSVCIGMCILEFSKVVIYEFHYDNVKNKYDNNSKLLFTDTESLICEIKTEDVYGDFSSDKEMFDFSNYSTKSKYYDDSNRLVIRKMKNKTGGVSVEEFVGLKPKMYSSLVDKANVVNRNVIATISHNEYKDVLLGNNCILHSMNRIQSKIHRIGTHEINKISLSCFDNKIYIQNNGYHRLAPRYKS